MELNRCKNITKEQFTRSRMLYGILKKQLDRKLGTGSYVEPEDDGASDSYSKNSKPVEHPDRAGLPTRSRGSTPQADFAEPENGDELTEGSAKKSSEDPKNTQHTTKKTRMERLSRMMLGNDTGELPEDKRPESFFDNFDVEKCRNILGSYHCPYGGCL